MKAFISFDHLLEVAREEKPKDIFAAVCSNPPYQIETAVTEDQEQPTVTNIFQEFQEVSKIVGKKTSMVYPAGRWIQRSGKGLKEFGKALINDRHLQKLDIYPGEGPDAIFSGVRMPGGISVVFWDSQKDNGGSFLMNGLSVKAPGDMILPISPKLAEIVSRVHDWVNKAEIDFVSSRGFTQKLYSIESNFAEENPSLVHRIYNNEKAPASMKDPIKLFTNDVGGKGGKPVWFWTERDNVKTNSEKIDRWQVVTQSAIFEGVAFLFSIIKPGEAHGRVRVSVADFSTEAEAKNFMDFMKLALIGKLLRGSDVGGLSNLAAFVPDLAKITNPRTGLVGYTSDWTDEDLNKLFEDVLTPDDWDYIEKTAIVSDPVGAKK